MEIVSYIVTIVVALATFLYMASDHDIRIEDNEKIVYWRANLIRALSIAGPLFGFWHFGAISFPAALALGLFLWALLYNLAWSYWLNHVRGEDLGHLSDGFTDSWKKRLLGKGQSISLARIFFEVMPVVIMLIVLFQGWPEWVLNIIPQ